MNQITFSKTWSLLLLNLFSRYCQIIWRNKTVKMILNYHYLGLELMSTCFVVQTRSGNTTTPSSPWMINAQRERERTNEKKITHFKINTVHLYRSFFFLSVYQEASSESSSIPCCSMGLKRRVRGKGTLAVWDNVQKELNVGFPYKQHIMWLHYMFKVRLLLVTNPEKVQLIQPPMRIMGSTLVTFPFIMSVSMLGSVRRYSGRQHALN